MSRVYINILFFMLPVLVQAQIGTVTGIITDPDSQTLPGVNIVIQPLQTGTVSDTRGNYRIDRLPPGNYTMHISMIGFRKFTTDITIQAGENLKVDVVLSPMALESGEIVVTAARQAMVAGSVPMSVSIIRGLELERRNSLTLDDALRYVPGVQMAGNQVNIRGSSGFSYGVGSRVLLLVDGVPLLGPDSGDIKFDGLPMAYLERIEVVKGPGSALYGGGALGGVLNLITKDYPDRRVTQVKIFSGAYPPVRYKKWHTFDEAEKVSFFYGSTITHAAPIGKYGGFWVNSVLKTDAGYLQEGSSMGAELFGKFGWRINLNRRFDTFVGFKRIKRDQFLYWNGLDDALRPGRVPFGESNTGGGFNNGLADHFTVIPTYSVIKNEKFSYNVKARVFGVAFRPLNSRGNIRDREKHNLGIRYGGETQVNWIPTKQISFVSGASFDANAVEGEFFIGEDSLTARTQPEYGVFLQSGYNITQYISLSAGIRYDAYQIHTQKTADKISPKLSLSWQWHSGWSMRASYGQGFRVPSIAERFVNNRDFLPLIHNMGLRPEESEGFELGNKGYISLNENWTLTVDGAVFSTNYRYLVEPKFIPSEVAFQFVNLTRARITGVEGFFNLESIDERLSFQTSYTYLDARDLTDNKPLVFRSRHLLQLSATAIIWKGLDAGIDFRFASKPDRLDSDFQRFVKDAAETVDIKVVDIRIGYDLPQNPLMPELHIDLLIKNITDYYYVERPAILAPPRHFLIQAQVRF